MKKFSKYGLTILMFCITLFILTSCGPKIETAAIPSYRSVSAKEISNIISNCIPPLTMFPKMVIGDANYILPTEEWVKGKFTSECRSFRFYNKLERYNESRNDCDNFSLYGRTVANILNVHNANKVNAGIAVGELQYVGGVYGHSINFIIVANKFGEVKVIYYEPQAYQIITLTDGMWAPLVYDL